MVYSCKHVEPLTIPCAHSASENAVCQGVRSSLPLPERCPHCRRSRRGSLKFWFVFFSFSVLCALILYTLEQGRRTQNAVRETQLDIRELYYYLAERPAEGRFFKAASTLREWVQLIWGETSRIAQGIWSWCQTSPNSSSDWQTIADFPTLELPPWPTPTRYYTLTRHYNFEMTRVTQPPGGDPTSEVTQIIF